QFRGLPPSVSAPGEATRMDHFAAQYDRPRSLLAAFLPPQITDVLLRLAGPALRLAGRGEVPADRGGAPVLPPGEPWPSWSGRPLHILGAIYFHGLATSVRIAAIPASGRTAIYYATGPPRPWGDDAGQCDGWRILPGDHQEPKPPLAVLTYPRTRLYATPYLSLPSPHEPVMRRLEAAHSGLLPVYEQLQAAWSRHLWSKDVPAHQLGGWPALEIGRAHV